MTRSEGSRPLPEPGTPVVILSGQVAPGDVAGLCERARSMLERRGADLVVCDVSALVDPDAAAIEALARLRLTARRLGCRVLLRDPCGELRELLTFAGLADVFPFELRIEPAGQTEEREQPLGVEEEADARDPPA